MLTNSGTNWEVVGDPVRANSYTGYTNGVHTVQFTFQNFIGGVGIQGTLAVNPGPEDWFWIQLNPAGNSEFPFLTYPLDQFSPTGTNGGDTGSVAATFLGNFVYLRAVVTREHMAGQKPSDTNMTWVNWTWGQVDRVLLSV